eukprot:TRINITY_DN46121_c0_g1_i1.p1 TRINITY_DN46121_c0_g1~~TRINITY_DN46121_c0_g1_i1.p1  ORF type:complete len:419 (+),score=81.72 TRINITY_DN46121_c0_g1_i1:37-1293(+)
MDLLYLHSIGLLPEDAEDLPQSEPGLAAVVDGKIEEERNSDASESDDDDDVLFTERLSSSETIVIPVCASNDFFHVTFDMTGFAPPRFALKMGMKGAAGEPVGPATWCQLVGLDAMTAWTVVELLGILDNVGWDEFLHAPHLDKRYQDVPAVAVLFQLFGLVQVKRLRSELAEQFRSSQELVCCYFDMMCELCAFPPSAFQPLLTIREVLPSVYHVHAAARVVLGSTFLRIQEYVESPSDALRYKRFSLDEFKTWYREHGCQAANGFNYYLIWPGFNVPSWVIDDLAARKLGPLRSQEAALLDSLPKLEQPFYVIGTCETDVSTLHHEMAHGLYATCKDYHACVREQIDSLPADAYDQMRQHLLSSGYPNDKTILEDEMHAYMVEGNFLADEPCQKTQCIQKELSSIFARFANVELCQ